MNVVAILILKSIALAIGGILLWEAHRASALVCSIASPLFLVFAYLAWREK